MHDAFGGSELDGGFDQIRRFSTWRLWHTMLLKNPRHQIREGVAESPGNFGPLCPSQIITMTDLSIARMPLVPGEIIEGWKNREIEAFFRHSYVLGAPPPTSLSLDAHNPNALCAFRRFWWSTFHAGSVVHRLKEALRVQIAQLRDCDY